MVVNLENSKSGKENTENANDTPRQEESGQAIVRCTRKVRVGGL